MKLTRSLYACMRRRAGVRCASRPCAATRGADTRSRTGAAAEVVTSATRTERDSFDLPVAIDSVDQSAIREDQPQVNLSESLNRVPGIAILNRQNYAQDLQISSRGFGARSTFGVRGIRLIADGIPATLPDGQAQAATFNLGSAERIEVMRGPFSSLYGNAAGGVIQLFTADGPPEPTVSGSLFGGSYGMYKGDLQFGGQDGPFNYIVDASRFHTDGYRDHSTATRDQSNAKFKMPLQSGVLTMLVNTLDQPETQDPLGLSRAQVIANPRQADASATTFNTRKSVRQNQLGLVYDVNLGSADKLQVKTYLGDRQVTQYQAIPLAAQALANGVGCGRRSGFRLRRSRPALDAQRERGRTAAHLQRRTRLRPHGPASQRVHQQQRHIGCAQTRRRQHGDQHRPLRSARMEIRAALDSQRRHAPQPGALQFQGLLHYRRQSATTAGP